MHSLKFIRYVAGLWLACMGAPTLAHEFWLEPSSHALAPGDRLAVRLCLGDGFESQTVARDASRIEEFVMWGADQTYPMVGLDGADPAGLIRLDAAGSYVIAYRSNRAYTAQPDEQFVAYLHEDGLEAILPLRRHPDQPGRAVRESFSRYAKTLVRVGEGATLVDRPLGLTLELVAESPDTFVLLYDGRPLAGALLKAMRLGGREGEQAARSDAAGRVTFRIDAPGAWRVSAVHMTRPPAGVDAEWDSLWASLTFEIPGGTAPPAGGAACRNRAR
jgi:Domain of unknown function (DUF4198)